MSVFPNVIRTVALCGVVVGLLAPTASAQQLLLNRSCERSDVSGWTEELTWDCTDRDPATPQDGSKYFWMDQTNPSGVLTLRQKVSATEGTVYSFTGQYFTEDLSGDDEDLAGIVVDLLDSSGSTTKIIVETGQSETDFVERTDGTWKTANGVERAPEGTVEARVELRVKDGASGGYVEAYLDDLQLIGKVQITEIMQNPSAVSDSDGEYVELYNSTASDISIGGWTLNGQSIGSVTVPARGFAVLCRNSDANQNGGVAACDDELSFNLLGDDSDTVTLADGSGVTIDQVNYDVGSGWPDPSGESIIFTALSETSTASNWAKAPRRERGFRLNESGDLGSPGRTGKDQLVQPSASVSSGSAGWQMLSAPVSGVNVNTLAQINLVQGFTDHFPGSDVNVYQWPGGTTSKDWQQPSQTTDLTNNLTNKGSGYIWYVFDGGNTRFTDTPPFSLSVPGIVRTSDITTDKLSGPSGAFHLLGNPYGQTLDLQGGVSLSGFSNQVQIWDPSDGSYVSVDASQSNLISAYQGFFVEKKSESDESVTFNASGRTFESADLKDGSPQVGQVGFRLTGQGPEGDTLTRDRALTLQARPEGTVGRDRYDASKLVPLAGRYVTAAFEALTSSESSLRAVSALPRTLSQEQVELPIVLHKSGADAVEALTLRWPEWTQMPDDWTLTLHDTAVDSTINLRTHSEYTFAAPDGKAAQGAASAQTSAETSSSVPVPRAPSSRTPHPQTKTASDSTRLVLVLGSSEIPVELTRLDAALEGREAVLRWRTASETNNAGFAVGHRGPGADSFQRLGFVSGQGTTDRAHDYRYRTDPLRTGTHTFRLRQVDTDGSKRTIRTVTLKAELKEPYQARVRPHPLSGRGTLELAVRDRQQVRVEVHDLLGRRVATLFNGALPANTTRQIPLRPGPVGLANGTYLLTIRGKTFVGTERLVIAR